MTEEHPADIIPVDGEDDSPFDDFDDDVDDSADADRYATEVAVAAAVFGVPTTAPGTPA